MTQGTSFRLPRVILGLGAICLLLTGVGFAQHESDTNSENESSIQKRVDASARVLDEIMGVKEKAIPDKVMSDAKCIAVIPSMVKIALGFGGSHGKGVATCRLDNGHWSSPAPITITGGSWGLQLGGQAVDLVLVVMNQHGMDALLSNKFKIGADASAAAGPVGRDAGADTDWKMKSEILTYSRARGVFAGIDLNGSAITQDKDETRLLYGKFVPFGEILDGKVHPAAGESDTKFEVAVRKYSEQAREREHAEGKSAPTGESASR
jgi:SH3 domain-containing YSC84-like protein 1